MTGLILRHITLYGTLAVMLTDNPVSQIMRAAIHLWTGAV